MSAELQEREPYHCPQCGAKHWLASAVHTPERWAPKPGDLSVCIRCAAVLVFEDGMYLRGATLAERVAGGPELELVVGAVLAVRSRK